MRIKISASKQKSNSDIPPCHKHEGQHNKSKKSIFDPSEAFFHVTGENGGDRYPAKMND